MFHTPYQNWYDITRVEYNEDVDVWNSVSVGFARGVYEEEPYKEYFLLNDYEVDGEKVRAAFFKIVYRF